MAPARCGERARARDVALSRKLADLTVARRSPLVACRRLRRRHAVGVLYRNATTTVDDERRRVGSIRLRCTANVRRRRDFFVVVANLSNRTCDGAHTRSRYSRGGGRRCCQRRRRRRDRFEIAWRVCARARDRVRKRLHSANCHRCFSSPHLMFSCGRWPLA